MQRYAKFFKYANSFLSYKGTIFLFLSLISPPVAGELTKISYELLRQLGNDEAAEGGIVLLFGRRCGVRVDAKELRIGTRETLVGEFDVLVVLLLPKGYYTFIMFFFRCSPENSTFRFRVVFVSFSSRFRLVSVFDREIDATYLLSSNDRQFDHLPLASPK